MLIVFMSSEYKLYAFQIHLLSLAYERYDSGRTKSLCDGLPRPWCGDILLYKKDS